MSLKVIYRGYLSECKYSCDYCPFSKTVATLSEQQKDREALALFVAWVEKTSRPDRPFEMLITPLGEALTRSWYREAIIKLSKFSSVEKIAIQTNLSSDTKWFTNCNLQTTAVWATFHPDFTTVDSFARKCNELYQQGIRFSAGAVGVKKHFTHIQELRKKLPASVYLWINAYKHQPNYYNESDLKFLEEIDPLFRDNLHYYKSLGQNCQAGSSVISIEGNGDLYRCHFIKEKRGNIFHDSIDSLLKKEPCTNDTCHCHIGYIYLDYLQLSAVYRTGMLERIPEKQILESRKNCQVT